MTTDDCLIWRCCSSCRWEWRTLVKVDADVTPGGFGVTSTLPAALPESVRQRRVLLLYESSVSLNPTHV